MVQKDEGPAPPCSGREAKTQIADKRLEDTRHESGVQAPGAPGPGDKIAALYALVDMNLSASAFAVMTVLIWHCNKTTGRCDPSEESIAREAGVEPRTVRRAIRALERVGSIKIIRHGGGHDTNSYLIDWPMLRRRYRAWLLDHGLFSTGVDNSVDTPDRNVRPDRTGMSGTPDRTVRQIVSESENESSESRTRAGRPESRPPSSPSLKRDEAGQSPSLGYQENAGTSTTASAIRRSVAKPKGQRSKDVATSKAHERLNAGLLAAFEGDMDGYMACLDRLDDETRDKALAAEINRRGSGLALILEAMTAKAATGKQTTGTLHLPPDGEAHVLAKYGKEVEQ